MIGFLVTCAAHPTNPLPPDQAKSLRRRLLAWYRKHRRQMPWRVVDGRPDPYHVLVSEAEIAQAIRDTAATERFMIEGAAGVAVASALRTGSDYRGRNIAVIVCGRNISLEVFARVLAGADM